MTEIIRQARPGDETELTAMIHELAEFERASADCTVTESQLAEALFGDHPTVYGHIAEVDGQAAAGALWFRNFSTWDGVAGIYLEDLYVRPQFRRRGLARKMLATLARECVNGGYSRLSWAVLDWNVDAIALYDAVGGRPQTEWITYRVSGPELSALGRVLTPQPLQGGRAEQQHQRHQRDHCDGCAVEPLVRSDGHVPGHRQQEQLREDRDPAAPPAPSPQCPARGEHGRAHNHEPAGGAVPTEPGLVFGACQVTRDQHRCDRNQRGALQRHHDGGLAHSRRGGNGHEASLLSVIVVRYRGEFGPERPRIGI